LGVFRDCVKHEGRRTVVRRSQDAKRSKRDEQNERMSLRAVSRKLRVRGVYPAKAWRVAELSG
jgi:hypothetical protein